MCGDVASWRNETDWKQPVAKLINFSSLNHMGITINIWGALPPNTPRGYGPGGYSCTVSICLMTRYRVTQKDAYPYFVR